MTEDDIRLALKVNEHQHKIYVPNEIFNDLQPLYDKGSSHVAFAYSFYYLTSWLYRYAKYGELHIDTGLVKQVLGYSPDNKKVNYIIKKNGFLDEIGYSYSDTDYPAAWEFNEKDIKFTMLSEFDIVYIKEMQKLKGKNYKIKVPVKGIWRNGESRSEGIENGTFYEIDYTHEMNFDLFLKCMGNDELGVSGFYLYGYLKYRCDKFKEYTSSVERIGEEVGMSRNTTDKYLAALVQNGLIGCKKNECENVDGKLVRKAHTYTVK